MPIAPRLSARIYPLVEQLIEQANLFIFLGTWNHSFALDLITRVFNAASKKKLLVVFLLPPPTDLVNLQILGKIVRNDWGVKIYKFHEIAAYLSQHPNIVEDYLQKELLINPQLEKFYKYIYLGRKKFIEQISQAGAIPLLLPNTHAKFVVTENGFYEGSGNLTVYGTSVNIENYITHSMFPKDEADKIKYEYIDYIVDHVKPYLSLDKRLRASRIEKGSQAVHATLQTLTKVSQEYNTKSYNIVNAGMSLASELETARESSWGIAGHKRIEADDLIARFLSRGVYTRLNDILKLDHESESGQISLASDELNKYQQVKANLADEIPGLSESVNTWLSRRIALSNIPSEKELEEYELPVAQHRQRYMEQLSEIGDFRDRMA